MYKDVVHSKVSYVTNALNEFLSGEHIYKDGIGVDIDYTNTLEFTRTDLIYNIREKLLRDPSFIDKAFNELSKHSNSIKYRINYMKFMQIVMEYIDRDNRCLKNMPDFASRVVKKIQQIVDIKQSNINQ